MSTNLNDRNAVVISELAYVADKLGRIDITQAKNMDKIFFDENGSIREEIKVDKDLYVLAQNIKKQVKNS